MPDIGGAGTDAVDVCVIGLGHIGLPTAAVLAGAGCRVHGVDVEVGLVEAINLGRAPCDEPGLDRRIRAAVEEGRLYASQNVGQAYAFVICVPTTLGEERIPDLGTVGRAVDNIVPWLRPGNLVVLVSTVPVGTTEEIAARINRQSPADRGRIYLAHVPEHALPGRLLHEIIENDRVVGGVDEAATDAACRLYARFVKGRLLRTSARTAEAVKLIENAFRDVNIAFANEVSMLADDLNVDYRELIALANHHPRVDILAPGPGVGGRCLSVDPYFLMASAPMRTTLIAAGRKVNALKTQWVIDRVKQHVAGRSRQRIACLGLAYKPNTGDCRGSAALAVVEHLARETDAELIVVEPHLREHPRFFLNPLLAAVEAADLVVVLVAHRAFEKLEGILPTDTPVIDTCGLLNKHRL